MNAPPDAAIDHDAIRTIPCQSSPQHLAINICIGEKVREHNKREHKSAREVSKLTLADHSKRRPAKRRNDSAHTHANPVLTRLLREQFGEARQRAACGDRITVEVAHSRDKRTDKSLHVAFPIHCARQSFSSKSGESPKLKFSFQGVVVRVTLG